MISHTLICMIRHRAFPCAVHPTVCCSISYSKHLRRTSKSVLFRLYPKPLRPSRLCSLSHSKPLWCTFECVMFSVTFQTLMMYIWVCVVLCHTPNPYDVHLSVCCSLSHSKPVWCIFWVCVVLYHTPNPYDVHLSVLLSFTLQTRMMYIWVCFLYSSKLLCLSIFGCVYPKYWI